MNMRKLFAGVAAAATLLGGLALGATTANAAEVDATFTVNAGADFTFADNQLHAYYIGAYSNPKFDTDGKATSVDVTAASDAVKTAAAQAAGVTDLGGYPDAVAYFAANKGTAAQLKAFADSLSNQVDQLGAAATPTLNEEKKIATFSNLQQGWYLVTDASGSSLLVGTKIWNAVANNGDGAFVDLANQELGTANAKPSSVPTPGKTANKDSVTVGDTIDYTLTGTVPNYTGYDTYQYDFVDTPSDKLSINENSVVVKIGNKDVTDRDGVTVTYPSDTVKTLTIAIDAAKFAIGDAIEITYTATVTGDAEGDIVNSVVIKHDQNESGTPGKTTVKTTPVQFKKVGVDTDAEGLAGATFTIAPKDGTPALPQGYEAEQTSNNNGLVKFAGLANGTYTITETGYVDGYLETPLSFDITVQDGTVTFTKDLLGLVTPGANGADTTVKNVKSITELPQTGAAGIAMFTVIAALLAGAAATVYGKSRKASAALRA